MKWRISMVMSSASSRLLKISVRKARVTRNGKARVVCMFIYWSAANETQFELDYRSNTAIAQARIFCMFIQGAPRMKCMSNLYRRCNTAIARSSFGCTFIRQGAANEVRIEVDYLCDVTVVLGACRLHVASVGRHEWDAIRIEFRCLAAHRL